jgi:hypothetical protein
MNTDKNSGSAFLYMVKTKQEQLLNSAMNNADNDNLEKTLMTETKIYVGLNDGDTKKQIYETKKYLSLLKKVCKSYNVAFSVEIDEGGYFHENGEYTEETSLVLILIDADKNLVREIANDLCTFFNQESVLVTENKIAGYFIAKEELL